MDKMMVLAAALAVAALAAAPALAQQGAASGEEEEFTVNFALRVEGEPPDDAAFSGTLPFASGPLTDPDGDGLYTGSVSFPAYVVGGEDGVSDDPVPVAISEGTGRAPSGRPAEPFPGAQDGTIIVDFGPVTLQSGRTFSGSYSFEEGADGGGSTGGNAVGMRVVGTDGPDELSGAAADDLLIGGYGDDLLEGGDGDDLLAAQAGVDRVEGGPGNDALYAAYTAPAGAAPNAPASPDVLLGGDGNDFLDSADAVGAADAVYCGGGDDAVVADAEDLVADDCEEVRSVG